MIKTGSAYSEKTEVVILTQKSDTYLISSLHIDQEAINITATITPSELEQLSFEQFQHAIEKADVIFVDRFLPSNLSYLHCLISHINGTIASKSFVLYGILNGTSSSETSSIPDFNPNQVSVISDILPVHLATNYISSTNESTEKDYKIQTKVGDAIDEKTNIFTKDIPWESASAISYRTLVTPKDTATVILESIDGDYSLAAEWTLASGAKVMFISIEIMEENLPFKLWPYFNYFNYVLALHLNNNAADDEIKSYADWGHGPLPKPNQIAIWFTVVGILWAATFLIYKKFKSWTKNDPLYSDLIAKYNAEAELIRRERNERKAERQEEKKRQKQQQERNIHMGAV